MVSSLTKKQIIFIGIVLLLALAIPLTAYLAQKTTIFRPRAQEATNHVHSVVNFDPKVEQVLSPGDTLEGKGIPNAKVSVSITPDGDSKEVDVDKDGKWTYQIPPTIQPKNYNLTVIIKDIENNIASIKTYPVQITQQQTLLPNSFNFIKTARAQEGLPHTPTVCSFNNPQCPAGTTCNATPDQLGYCNGPTPIPTLPPPLVT